MDAHSSLSSHPHCSSQYYGLQRDRGSSKHNKRLDFPGTGNCPRLLEQPRLLPTAQAAPRQIDYTDHLQSKLTELFPGFMPSSYPITRNVNARAQATPPPPGSQLLPSAAQHNQESSWVGSKYRKDWECVWQQQGELEAAPRLYQHKQELAVPFVPVP